MNDFTLEIKSKANEIGFEKIGIAEIEPIKNAKANLESWILKGNHASMNWIEKRKNECQHNVGSQSHPTQSVRTLALQSFWFSSPR